jgi:K+-transporting ATPase ATPase B chain
MAEKVQARPLFDPFILKRAIKDSFKKLDPRRVAHNPVMFVVEIGSLLTTLLIIRDIAVGQTQNLLFTSQVAFWLWFTVIFANFAEAMAEGLEKHKPKRFAKPKPRRMGAGSCKTVVRVSQVFESNKY